MKTVLLDYNGTVVGAKSGHIVPQTPDDQFLLPNVMESLLSLKNSGSLIAIITNQGGVSCGYSKERDFWETVFFTEYLLGFRFDHIEVCFFHETGLVKDRGKYVDRAKPKPDMLLSAIYEMGAMNRDIKETVFVGDGFSDEKTAEYASYRYGAEIPYQWAHNYFNWPVDSYEETSWGFTYKLPEKVNG